MRARRFITTLIAALYFGALIGLTFMPGSAASRALWFWPFLAFVPVGLLLVVLLGRRRWWVAIAFSVLGSGWIEAAQSVWMPEGYADATDVLWASAGGILGVGIAFVATAPRRVALRAHESPSIVAQGGRREIPQD